MSRDIKFRLRDRENRIVGHEKWYTGVWNEDAGFWIAQPLWLYSKNNQDENETWNPTYIFHKFKDEFTCLKDKNGKEIYEGDIIKELLHNNPLCAVVKWEKDTAGFSPFNHELWDCESCGSYNLCDMEDIEIIGNIYENPELLNNTKEQ